MSKKVDFTRQVVLAFAWRGSGRDKLTSTIAESFPEQIFFKFRPGRTRDLRSHIHIYALRSNVTWRGPKGAGGGPYTKTKPVNKQPAAAAVAAPPGGMQLLPGYTHKPLQGIDSIVGQIVKDDGWKISYEIGRVSKPGQPMMGGGFRDRPKLMPKTKVRWYREQTVSGRAVHMALTKDNTLLVSFPDKGMNFHATVRSFEQLADAMLMILTYSQPAPAGAKDKTAKSSDAGKLAQAPATITVGGKKLTLQVEGINNRMPTVGARTRTGIYFIIRLKTTDRSAMPRGVTFDAVYGVQGKRKWETRKFDGPRGRVSSMVEIVARNAPAWTVSGKIDVIVRLRDAAGKEHLIRAANVRAMAVH
jgi:hypothetical protein